MPRRYLVLAIFGLLLCSCTDMLRCSASERETVSVRWPVTAQLSPDLRRTGAGPPDAEPWQDLLGDAAAAVPGVKVRGGRALDLDFLEVVMGEADFEDALPLVVLIHGRGDRPRVPGGPFGGIPTAMRVILPRAPRRLGAGFSWLSVSITSGRIRELTEGLRTRANHLAAFIRWVESHRPTLGRPIVSGFSQGGMLSFVLATLRPDVVSSAFPIAGWLPPGLVPTSGPPPAYATWIRSAHGGADRVIPVEPTRKVVEQLRALGWDVELEVYPDVGHVVDRRMNAAFEAWLEEAVGAQAPGLGGGLGALGPEGTTYGDYEPLEQETLLAIAEEEATLASDAEAPDEEALDGAGGETWDAGGEARDARGEKTRRRRSRRVR